MIELLRASFENGQPVDPWHVLVRLVAALALGAVVAWIYGKTHTGPDIGRSFPTTLVLLAVLIAMVTQVIGDNVARAFSLVGALSIVRFRTVVRDTKDTAFVIFAVVIGMAVGAHNPWVATLGLAIVGLAAYVMSLRIGAGAVPAPVLLTVRVSLTENPRELVDGTIDAHLEARELMAVSTAKQGACLDLSYEARMRGGGSAEELVRALNRIDGVQEVKLQRRGFEMD